MVYKVVWQHIGPIRCGEIFNNHFTANLLQNLAVKEFWTSIKIWQIIMAMSLIRIFLTHPVVAVLQMAVKWEL